MKPSIAIISAGAGNRYGHPTQETLAKLNAMSVKVYRTDLNGTVIINSDGSNISVRTEIIMKRGIIDRFEGKLAVIEVNNVTIDVPKSKLPATAKEGDVLIIEDDTYTIDKDETDKRRREIQNLMNKLFE